MSPLKLTSVTLSRDLILIFSWVSSVLIVSSEMTLHLAPESIFKSKVDLLNVAVTLISLFFGISTDSMTKLFPSGSQLMSRPSVSSYSSLFPFTAAFASVLLIDFVYFWVQLDQSKTYCVCKAQECFFLEFDDLKLECRLLSCDL